MKNYKPIQFSVMGLIVALVAQLLSLALIRKRALLGLLDARVPGYAAKSFTTQPLILETVARIS